jgi:transcriptional regulator with XRE-family HTH domain
MEFGQRLREARERAGLTQAQVAERLGLRQTHISRVEHGQHFIEFFESTMLVGHSELFQSLNENGE